jgi:hypothetical protein
VSPLQLGDLRLDRINSRQLIRSARNVYYRFLEACPGAAEPVGVVMAKGTRQGRVVFEPPVLLQKEHFVPIEWLRLAGPRSRTARSGAAGGRPSGLRPSGPSR